MAKHNARLLVHQTSGFVVWLSYNFESYPPIVDPSLNYKIFYGDTKIDLLDSYSNYKLYYADQTNTFSESDSLVANSAEFLSAQLLRAKVVTLYHAIRTVKTKYERLDLMNTNLYDSLKTVTGKKDPWVDVYQKEHNCTSTEALKLIKFHVAEYETATFNLESALLMFKNRVKSAGSLEELSNEYNIYCTKMIVDPFDLRNLPIICGPL